MEILETQSGRKKIVYFHRYAIEDEANQFPGLRVLLSVLKKQYEVVYVSMRGRQSPDRELRKDLKIMEIPLTIIPSIGWNKWIKTILYYLFLPWTLARLRQLQPALIICKEPLPFVPSVVSRLKIPTLIEIGDWWWSIFLGKGVKGKQLAQWIERHEIKDWAQGNTLAIFHTQSEFDLMRDSGFPLERLRKLKASHHDEVYFSCDASTERKRLNFSSEDWVVVVHGIMHPSKGYEQILTWWKQLVLEHPNWKLLMIGGASNEKTYQTLVKNLHLEKQVIFAGWLPTQNVVNRYLNVADCLLVTRRNSPENRGVIPSALNHSLALGKPVVATGLPGMSEVIHHGENGYLYEPDNYESFKSVLENIAKNPEQALKVAQEGKKILEEFFNTENFALEFKMIIDRWLS